MHEERQFFVETSELFVNLTQAADGRIADFALCNQLLIECRILPVFILDRHPVASFVLPFRDEVRKPFDVVCAVFGCRPTHSEHTIDRILPQCFFDVLVNRYPVEIVFFFLCAVLRCDSVSCDAFDEEQSDHPVLDRLYFDELFHVDVTVESIHVALTISESELRLLIDFSECALVAVLTLVDLSFWEIKLLDNLVTRVVIDDEENFVKCLVED